MDRSPRNEENMPAEERHQPDPMLQLSVGRVGGGAVTLVVIVAAVLVAVVLYGLSSPNPTEQAASAPSAQNAQPQAGGQPGPANSGAPRANQSGTKG
jgi:hypothetical protein